MCVLHDDVNDGRGPPQDQNAVRTVKYIYIKPTQDRIEPTR